MVIFRSYVSLPEGTSYFFKGSPALQGLDPQLPNIWLEFQAWFDELSSSQHWR